MERVTQAQFSLGDTVHHKLFGYRGVVVDIDPEYLGSDEWYDKMAKTNPPKDRPWYRILVHRRRLETYVAERNLELDETRRPIRHPLVPELFGRFHDGRYEPRLRLN